MADHEDPFAGFYKKAKHTLHGGMLGAVPTSVIALSALSKKSPELAKRIFTEGYFPLARDLFGEEPSAQFALDQLDEIEAKFRQQPVEYTYKELEMLFVTQRIAANWTKFEQTSHTPLTKDDGNPTMSGMNVVNMITWEVEGALASYLVSCEKLITLLLAAALVGPDALEAEINRWREKGKPQAIEEIAKMLAGNGFKHGSPALEKQLQRIIGTSDDQVMSVFYALQGYWFASRKHITRLVEEALGIESDIEF